MLTASIHGYSSFLCIFTAYIRIFLEGNVFSCVCLSVHKGRDPHVTTTYDVFSHQKTHWHNATMTMIYVGLYENVHMVR